MWSTISRRACAARAGLAVPVVIECVRTRERDGGERHQEKRSEQAAHRSEDAVCAVRETAAAGLRRAATACAWDAAARRGAFLRVAGLAGAYAGNWRGGGRRS